MYKILVNPKGHEGMYFEDKEFTSSTDALEYAIAYISSAFHIVKIISFTEKE